MTPVPLKPRVVVLLGPDGPEIVANNIDPDLEVQIFRTGVKFIEKKNGLGFVKAVDYSESK